MKILIACDSFKGSLTTFEVADAASKGARKAAPEAEIETVGIADGGEGTAEVVARLFDGRKVGCRVKDSLGREIDASYYVAEIEGRRTAIIEASFANGLNLVEPAARDVMQMTTYGTGQLIALAYSAGIRDFLIGLGGSGTIDGGIGMLEALGVRFTDAQGNRVEAGPSNLSKIESFIMPDDKGVFDCRFTVLTDVTTALTGGGQSGCAYIYGPQKGATENQMETIDKGFRHLEQVILRDFGVDLRNRASSGAAGGLAASFMAFFNARIVNGIDYLLALQDFKGKVKTADLVITGEGRIDRTTLKGKAPCGVMQEALAFGVPTVGICGSVENDLPLTGFCGIFPIVSGPCSVDYSMSPSVTRENISRTVEQIVRLYMTSSAM